MDLNEMKKKIEKEKGKKEKADKRIKEMRAGLIDAAFDTIVDKRLFSKTAFGIRRAGYNRGWEIQAWCRDFGAEMVEAWVALDGVGVNQVTLVPKEFEKSSYAVRSNVRVDKNSDSLTLMIGEDAEIAFLKAVVQDYGVRVDLAGMKEAIESERRNYKSGMKKLKEKLILSGMAEGLPLSDLEGYHGEYLEIEEQYARMLHNVFKREATDHGLVDHKELRHDFELLDPNTVGVLFMEMGRAMFCEIMEKE